MIGNKLEQEIIGIFSRDISALLSINQISKKLNKAYPYINAKVNLLIKEGVLDKTEIGRSYLCSINLGSAKAIALLSLYEANQKEKYLKKTNLLPVLDKIRKEFNLYTIFAIEKKLYFVLDHIYDKEAIKNSYKLIREFSPEFLSKQDFVNLILQNKAVLSNKIILYSPETYYELLEEMQSQIMGKKFKNA